MGAGKLGILHTRIQGGSQELPEKGRERAGRPGHNHAVDVAEVNSLLPSDQGAERVVT
jgi:hypothetical protein